MSNIKVTLLQAQKRATLQQKICAGPENCNTCRKRYGEFRQMEILDLNSCSRKFFYSTEMRKWTDKTRIGGTHRWSKCCIHEPIMERLRLLRNVMYQQRVVVTCDLITTRIEGKNKRKFATSKRNNRVLYGTLCSALQYIGNSITSTTFDSNTRSGLLQYFPFAPDKEMRRSIVLQAKNKVRKSYEAWAHFHPTCRESNC